MWSETDFWPRCLATGVATFAVVMPKSLAAHLALDKVFQAWVPEKKGGERRFFADVETARKWLSGG